ncbi:hypothetical protein BRC86_10075 [Halobacteriales archaeon QS_3_64_16]|nr:MAG: hypothetical protein BRC86_10075 [Halobacteriales archaeon QS_3_64_16]
MSEDFGVVTPAEIEPDEFDTVAIPHRKYTDALGCTDSRVNYIALEPGEKLTSHAHERQEELFVPLTGGEIEINGAVYDVPQGGVVRVGPGPIRGLLNRSDGETHCWIAIGAPPVGTIEDFGEYVLPEGEGSDGTDG